MLTPDPTSLHTLPLRSIRPHPRNPRFDLGDLTDLTADIRDNGLIEPLIVVPGSWGKATGLCGDCDTRVRRTTAGVLSEHMAGPMTCPGGSSPASDEWTVVAGHRRRECAIAAGLWAVPCVTRHDLRSVADQIALMLRENGHRRDLTALEEAHGYEQLTLEGLTATRIAQQVKRSKRTVDRRLALLKLDAGVQSSLKAGTITLQDAEALLDLPPEKADRALRSVGTREFRQEVARQRIGSDGPAEVAAELRYGFLAPYLDGSQRPAKTVLPRLRREVVATLADRLPKVTTRAWLGSLGIAESVELITVDPDRALLALAVAIETTPAGQYDLLGVLGYELSPIEIELLEQGA